MAETPYEHLLRLVEPDPKASAERLLTYLIRMHRARGGAVFRARRQDFSPFVVQLDSATLLVTADAAWKERRTSLQAGAIIAEDSWAMLPIVSPRSQALLGVLFLSEPQRGPDAGAASAPLAATLEAEPSLVNELDDLIGLEEIKKHRILRALQREEWNIARVARKLGYTRRTVYLQMQRYGIERRKIVKTPKRRKLKPEEMGPWD